MADLSDVESALSSFIISLVYADGLSLPSLTSKPIRVYRGMPVRGALERDLEAGIVNVSVFAAPNTTRNTTRWGVTVNVATSQPSLTAVAAENSVVFGGSGGAGQLAGLLVDGIPFVYRLQDGDTPALVAAVLADAVRLQRACLYSGTTVQIPSATTVQARVAADGSLTTEWGRQEQGFRISVWCPDPGSRDLVCSAIGRGFAAESFLTLADGTAGRLRYLSTTSFDDGQDAHLYRRDMLFSVEYGTTSVTPVASMLFGDLKVRGVDFYG